MQHWFPGVALALTVLAAHAQTASGGITESTDAAKAIAIEKAAAALKNRPPPPSVEIVRTTTADGHAILSGGITSGDRVAMHAERGRYSLWVATVAKPSGAYLADAELRITRTKGGPPVLERRMEGPWLFIALPPGPYEVSASFREAGAEKAQTITTRVNVPRQGQRQAVLRFASAATVEPDAQGPFQGNPFGAGPAKP